MPELCYYTRLIDSSKKAYNSIVSGLNAYAEEIELVSISTEKATKIFQYVLLDNPLIFQTMSYTELSYPNGRLVMRPNYRFSHQMTRGYTDKTLKYLCVFDSIKSRSAAEKELYVHDYCLKHFTYDRTHGEHANSVLGLVSHGTAVCEGIAKFVKLALNYLGMQCLVVTGEGINPLSGTKESHAWNIVKLGEQTYHLDVTFDMGLSGNSLRYDYFNLSDADIKKDHVIISDAPLCTTIGNDYYSLNSQVVNGPRNLTSYIEENLLKGKRDIVFKISNAHGVEDIVDRLMNIASDCYRRVGKGSAAIEISFNKGQMVFQVTYK